MSDIQHLEFVPLTEVKWFPTDKLIQLHCICKKKMNKWTTICSPDRMDVKKMHSR